MLRYFDSVGINLDSRLRVVTRREFAGMISVAIESDDAETTVDLGSPPRGQSGSWPSCLARGSDRGPGGLLQCGQRRTGLLECGVQAFDA